MLEIPLVKPSSWSPVTLVSAQACHGLARDSGAIVCPWSGTGPTYVPGVVALRQRFAGLACGLPRIFLDGKIQWIQE